MQGERNCALKCTSKNLFARSTKLPNVSTFLNNFAQISQGAREGRPRQAVLDLPPEEPQGVQGSAC